MLCPSCQRFPMCSEADILCIHVMNPVFNMTKVGFSFSHVSLQIALSLRSGSHAKHLFSAYQQQDIGFT